jgi:signal transduction histidine kinase
MDIHRDLSWSYLYADDYEKMIHHSREGIALAESLDSLYVAADLLNNLGVAYDYASRPDSAMIYFERALDVVDRMEDEGDESPLRIGRTRAFVYGSIANLYSIEGRSGDALEYYFMALRLFEEHEIDYEVGVVLGNIGITYYDIENYEQAETYLRRKEQICRELGYETNLAHALYSLSPVYEAKGEYDKAITVAEEALEILQRHDTNPADALGCLLALSTAWLRGYGDTERAMEYSDEALQKARELNIPLEISHVLQQRSEIFLFREEYAAAQRSALQALETDSTHLSNNQFLYEYLTKANIGLGNRQRALHFFERFKETQASYANEHFQEAMSEMEVRYETEKMETRITVLEEERRLMRMLGTAVGGVLLLTMAAFFFLWRWAVQRRRTVATRALLDGEAAERTRLARDLHDGLGSMLTGIRMGLENMRGQSAPDLAPSLDMLGASIRELRRVSHHLMPDALQNEGLRSALAAFCHSLPDVSFGWFGPEGKIDSRMELVIYRIAHELVGNALKHAGASEIAVQVMRGADYIALTVRDDGRGFDPATQPAGMGLANIRKRVASMDGRLMIDSRPGDGTEINVNFSTR